MNRIIADWAPFAGCPQSLAFGDRGLIPAVLTTTEKGQLFELGLFPRINNFAV